jgi:hypothetical protein
LESSGFSLKFLLKSANIVAPRVNQEVDVKVGNEVKEGLIIECLDNCEPHNG